MSSSESRFGLSAALTTPFDPDLGIDLVRLVRHARWCLAHGCASVTVFGTTGEGPSIGICERERVLGALAGAGIAMRQHVVAGVTSSAVDDAVAQARLALDMDCRALLIAPPFYYKGIGDEGVRAWFARLLRALGPAARDVFLYHIPSVTGVGLSVEVVGQLKTEFAGIVAGVKDSSGEWANTEALIKAHPDLAILIGDERSLAAGVRLGGQGAISGLANACPEALAPMALEGRDDRRIIRLVEEVLRLPVTPAVKALVAHRTGDPAWLRTRAPLQPVAAADATRLGALFDAVLAASAA